LNPRVTKLKPIYTIEKIILPAIFRCNLFMAVIGKPLKSAIIAVV
jgi:hypothetical protein